MRAPWIVFLFSFLVYTATLYQTVPGGDSGELITVAHIWGVAHPPGYPLYTVIAHLFTLIPFRSLAWRVSFLSAVCDALAAGLLTAAVIAGCRCLIPSARRSTAVAAGFFSSGIFAFSPGIWTYATQAEVFPLNNLFVAALLYLGTRYFESRDRKFLYLGSFFAGLGSFHHQIFIFCALPFLYWLFTFTAESAVDRRKVRLLCALLFCSGFSPYFSLPIAESFHPPLSWGETGSLAGFFAHFFRREYGTFQLGRWEHQPAVSERFFAHLGQYGRTLFPGSLSVLFVFSLPGLWISGRRFSWLPLSYGIYLLAFCLLSNSNLDFPVHRLVEERFWQQPNLILCFWGGLGFAWCARFVKSAWILSILPAAAVAIVFLQVALHYHGNDHSRNRVIEDYARSVLAPLEPHSVLIVTSDVAWNSMQYLQICEGFRQDVRVVSQEMMSYPWMRAKMGYRYPELILPASGPNQTMLDFVDSNQFSPIYLSFQIKESERSDFLKKYELIPIGIFDRVISRQDPSHLRKSEWIKRSEQYWSTFDLAPALQARQGSWEWFVGQLGELYQKRAALYRQPD